MWTATFGPLPGGLARVLTECTCSRPMASSSAEFISRKPAQIFVSGAPRKTACSWLPVSLSTHSTSTPRARKRPDKRSEEHTSELQSRGHLVCRLLLEKKKKQKK